MKNSNDMEIFCPNCGEVCNLEDDDADYTLCENCRQILINPSIYSGEKYENTLWYCDNCNALLNKQRFFTDTREVWTCLKCGYKNLIVLENIID